MTYFAEALVGTQIHSVFVDSEVTYIMLTNGTQLTIRGLVAVQPASSALVGIPTPGSLFQASE
jgi:hypothetical protein